MHAAAALFPPTPSSHPMCDQLHSCLLSRSATQPLSYNPCICSLNIVGCTYPYSTAFSMLRLVLPMQVAYRTVQCRTTCSEVQLRWMCPCTILLVRHFSQLSVPPQHAHSTRSTEQYNIVPQSTHAQVLPLCRPQVHTKPYMCGHTTAVDILTFIPRIALQPPSYHHAGSDARRVPVPPLYHTVR